MWCVGANINMRDVLDNRPGGIIRCGEGSPGMFLMSDEETCRWEPVSSKDTGPSLSEVAREHKARMAAAHEETMRQAKVGTWLLVAFVVAAGFAAANLLGGGIG